jgi:hypothetical protein
MTGKTISSFSQLLKNSLNKIWLENKKQIPIPSEVYFVNKTDQIK